MSRNSDLFRKNQDSSIRVSPLAHPPSAPLKVDGGRAASGTNEIGPPNSFSRLFLSSLDRYQKSRSARHIGSASEEASGYIAQELATHDRHAGSAVIKLRSPRAAFETVVVTAALPLVGWYFGQDPFFLKEGCFWLLLAPVLLGLRHGFAPAVTSAFILDSLILLAWRVHAFGVVALPGASLIGIAVFAMISGQFSDVWKREIVRLDGAFAVTRRQLNELSREHFLLELSYDKTLDAHAERQVPNLRDAIAAVRQLAQRSADGVGARQEASVANLARPMLEVMASYCLVETCSVYAVHGGRVDVAPAVCMGGTQGIDAANDLLVTEALRTKRLTVLTESGRDAQGATRARTSLLAAIPFVDTAGNVHGVLCVEAMPFVAFEKKHLETLFILGGHFADILTTQGDMSHLERGRRYEFEVRMRRALADLADHGIPCSVFGLIVQRRSAVQELVNSILGDTMRVLDFPLVERTADGNYAIFHLLPMTDEEGVQSLIARFAHLVESELHTTLVLSGADPFFHVLRKGQSVDEVMNLLSRKAQPAHAAFEHTAVG